MKDLHLSLIGVPTNSSGTVNGVANAPEALRRAGILEALDNLCDISDQGNISFSSPSTSRDIYSGIISCDSLVSMICNVRTNVSRTLQKGIFPLVLGGDCPVLIGCLVASTMVYKNAGLLFIDGHEDAYPPHQSPTGEAADMELGFALGLQVPKIIREAIGSVPLINSSQVCIIGARDKNVLRKSGIRSLEGLVEFYSDTDIRNSNIHSLGKKILRGLSSRANKIWLHVDLDVLSTRSFPSVDYQQPGGLNWKQLEELTKAALSYNNIIGCDVTIYNPDLDQDNRFAKRIIKYLEAVFR